MNVMKTAFGSYEPEVPTRPPGSVPGETIWEEVGEDEEGEVVEDLEDPEEEENLPSSAVGRHDPESEAQETRSKSGVKRKGSTGKVVMTKKVKAVDHTKDDKFDLLSKDIKLFFPTTEEGSEHRIGVNPKFMSGRETHGQDGSIHKYSCLFAENGAQEGYTLSEFDQECDYACQQKSALATHVRQVHLGHALGCHFCDWRNYRASNWQEHMKKMHASKKANWYVGMEVLQGVQLEVTEEVDADAVLATLFKKPDEA